MLVHKNLNTKLLHANTVLYWLSKEKNDGILIEHRCYCHDILKMGSFYKLGWLDCMNKGWWGGVCVIFVWNVLIYTYIYIYIASKVNCEELVFYIYYSYMYVSQSPTPTYHHLSKITYFTTFTTHASLYHLVVPCIMQPPPHFGYMSSWCKSNLYNWPSIQNAS